jgi:hypothetical protein
MVLCELRRFQSSLGIHSQVVMTIRLQAASVTTIGKRIPNFTARASFGVHFATSFFKTANWFVSSFESAEIASFRPVLYISIPVTSLVCDLSKALFKVLAAELHCRFSRIRICSVRRARSA